MKKLKYIFLSLFFLGTIHQSKAQLLCESFENTGPGCGVQAFLQGCFPDWINTHGSAGIKLSNIVNPSFGGVQHVRMYVERRVKCEQEDRGEGIALNYPFQAGQCYRFSYAIRGRAADVAWILTNGLSMNGNTDASCTGNDVVPNIPTGSMIVPGTNSSFNSSGWTHIQNIQFVPTSNFDQLWFRASNLSETNSNHFFTNVFLDSIKIENCCIRSGPNCEVSSDLTACPEEDDFGFIAIECPAEFEWDFPTGSTATELTSPDQSLVTNASPGLYTVTITDAAGCTEVSDFEILEVCCDTTTNQCVPPVNLSCISNHGQVIGLTWDPVPGAQAYVITITPNDEACGCKNEELPPIGIWADAPPHIFNVSYSFNCYSWSVQTVCKDGTYSEPSETICVDKFGCSERGK